MTVSVWLAFIYGTHVFWCVFAARAHGVDLKNHRSRTYNAPGGRVFCFGLDLRSTSGRQTEWIRFCVFLNSVCWAWGLRWMRFVSMANGLRPKMNKSTMCKIAQALLAFRAAML